MVRTFCGWDQQSAFANPSSGLRGAHEGSSSTDVEDWTRQDDAPGSKLLLWLSLCVLMATRPYERHHGDSCVLCDELACREPFEMAIT